MQPTFQTVVRKDLSQQDVLIDCLSAHGFRVEIFRRGAEMLSLQAPGGPSGGGGFLHRDGQHLPPETGWGNHATVMGYFLHRLWQQQSLYRGRLIQGGNHGFIRHFLFDSPEWDPSGGRLTYVVPADRVPPGAYPLRLGLRLSYELSAQGLEVTFAFHNEEPEETACFSFGLHPGFSVSDLALTDLVFPAGRYLRHLAPGNFLDGQTETIEHSGGVFPIEKNHLPDSYLLELTGVPERQFLLRDRGWSREVTLNFTDCPYLTLWSDGGNFLCVEPCWGLPDSHPPTPFEDKPGIQTLAPGATLKKSFRIFPSWQNRTP
jgi:galactose mutarotase-like enzyme